MIVQTIDEVIKSEDRNVETDKFNSRRFLLKKDGMGFSLMETILHEGAVIDVWYKNHVEACYVFEGEGELEVLEPEPGTYKLVPGTLYATNKHDKHILRILKTMKLVCVFNPPLTGLEVHDEDGSYAAPE